MTVTIQAAEMTEVLRQVFALHGFTDADAATLARVHTESTLYGVNSHGIDRVAKFIDYIGRGLVDTDARAARVATFGSIERYDGHSGPGVLNALHCTDRAITLAREHGMGLVALRNTNHWMRGGTYGWRTAAAGCIGILFTNTTHNMPAWGGRDPRTGNNPLIIAIPRAGGHVVLDMALSQFSFGGLNAHRLRGEELPFPGGWDAQGQLTTTPADIIASERALPIGYWKGSALSMVLDMLATLLSAGNSTYRIGQRGHETDVSQVFLCIDPARFHDRDLQQRLLDEIVDYNHSGPPLREGQRTYYPGERALQNMQHNLAHGMAVSMEVWREVTDLAQRTTI
ncbi:2,3-diketo-L-gulonate reductase [Neolewinella maritima]|uniref:2,3-diketo-L-gulonate reductase n=1 Tax=Neolewinella maritima TaxID=1383882 RepID=A0ABM9AWH7_9BACT|nr:3-dehydro-L-gulonate 2-dehydrogenase [Neolewinella maritima]CAH0999067.1 2,3-diketo-L-gulonate reductase [Neolewinella maritima]